MLRKEVKVMRKLITTIMAVVMILALGSACVLAEQNESEDETVGTGMLAGWKVSEDSSITSEIEQLLWTALDSYQTGTITVAYTPVAYLGSQLVAGTNHAVLCRASEINKGSSWVIIYLYEDLQGEATVLNVADFDFGSLCTYGAE